MGRADKYDQHIASRLKALQEIRKDFDSYGHKAASKNQEGYIVREVQVGL